MWKGRQVSFGGLVLAVEAASGAGGKLKKMANEAGMSFAINKSHFREPGMSFRISEAYSERTRFRSRNVIENT